MSSRLADRLISARRSHFVGRMDELELFQSVLAQPELPFYVLYIFGPGGIGKTTLLLEYVTIAQAANTHAFYLDCRDLEPSPATFQSVLTLNMGLAPGESPAHYLAAQKDRTVILLDTFEQQASLETWLRQEFLPQMPDNVLTILASRNAPSIGWRADAGWQSLIRILPLRNLNPAEGREYLVRRHVPDREHQAILDFTYSYPLALSLIADEFAQRSELHFEPEAASDIVHALLERLVQKVPGPAHRVALEACAMIRVTTESILGEMLAFPDVHELFDWLRNLSFIMAHREGLFPHDLVREALSADLRWRNPDWYSELHHRARNYYTHRLQQTSGQAQRAVLVDYVYLHRDNPMLRPFLDWQMRDSGLLTDVLRPTDLPAILDMVRQHEGEESAQLAAHWLKRQPEGVVVYRDDEGRPTGFLSMVALHEIQPRDIELDPAIQAVYGYLQQNMPLRPGEKSTLFRFWMAEDSYQFVSAAQSMIFITILQHYLTTAGLAITFFACADPDFWTILLAYANVNRLPEADFSVGGHTYGIYYHDWRIETPIAWLALMAEREVASEPPPPSATPAREPLLVLSEPDFAVAVRDALRDFQRADLMHANPLLRSRLIVKQVGPQAGVDTRIAALQSSIREIAASMQSSPRDAKFYRALDRTYFHPAPTQEIAAELLDLPFSTYRRHLKSGIDRITEILWHAELNSA
jgi:hypothetical protein